MRRLRSLIASGLVASVALLAGVPALGSEEHIELPKVDWAHGGVNSLFSFGKKWDYAALQRGFQVYREVCSACHSLNLLSYRNLEEIGFTEPEVKVIAASVEVQDGPNDQGEMFTRPGRPSDRFKAPFANKAAAAFANGGKAPPDLSLIVKAREGNEDYIYGILTGYEEAPHDVVLPPGGNYNKYFHGHNIAMPQPLSDGSVTYSDGTKSNLAQEAHDVVSFLAWAAEPKLVERRQTGAMVLLFLLVFSGILYAAKRRIWADQH